MHRLPKDEISRDHTDLDEGTLRRLYYQEHLTCEQIGRMYHCSKFPIRQKMAQWGLPAIAKWERHGLGAIPTNLMPMITGTLLGDAGIGFEGSGVTSRLKLSHSTKQEGYLRHIHSRLGEWARPVAPYRKVLGDKVHEGVVFTTWHHPEFRSLRKKFYRDDMRGSVPGTWLKAPPIDVFETLTDESLAYWYFDDGTRGEEPSIVVFFPLLDIEEVTFAVGRATRLPWRVNRASGAYIFNLRLPKSWADEFYARIFPWATPDLYYKVSPRLWDPKWAPRAETACSNCGIIVGGLHRADRVCPTCKKAQDAVRAQTKRDQHRLLVPPKLTRTFTCHVCGHSWATTEKGNFHRCPPCRGMA